MEVFPKARWYFNVIVRCLKLVTRTSYTFLSITLYKAYILYINVIKNPSRILGVIGMSNKSLSAHLWIWDYVVSRFRFITGLRDLAVTWYPIKCLPLPHTSSWLGMFFFIWIFKYIRTCQKTVYTYGSGSSSLMLRAVCNVFMYLHFQHAIAAWGFSQGIAILQHAHHLCTVATVFKEFIYMPCVVLPMWVFMQMFCEQLSPQTLILLVLADAP